MVRAVSVLRKIFVVLVLFTIFHFSVGNIVVDKIFSYYNPATGSSVERLTPLVTNSSYISSLEYNGVGQNRDDSLLSYSTGLSTVDPRVLAMRQFLISHYSPLYPYSETFVKEADKSGLDWRLVVSISGVESAFGNLIPYRSNNGWGWRGGPGGAYSIFNSWNDGISHVTQRLAIGYGTDLTPFQIEPVYCPPCGANPQHSWANGVTRFMNELQYYLENLESIY